MKTCHSIIILVLASFLSAPGTFALSYYENQVVANSGPAVANAQITVVSADSPLTPAELFADEGGQTPLAKPLQSDTMGFYSFFVASGTYHIHIESMAVSTTLMDVAIVDPRKPHHIVGSDERSPLTLVESATATTSGNAALKLERLYPDGRRQYGPWAMHINQGPAGASAQMKWLYNVDWDEVHQQPSGLLTADDAFQMQWALDTRQTCGGLGCFPFTLSYAPAGAVGSTPTWIPLLSHVRGAFDTLAPRVHHGPMVVGDGLENSSLIARRLNFDQFNTAAPAGTLLWDAQTIDGHEPGPAGMVVVAVDQSGQVEPIATTQHAQLDATVHHRRGNGTTRSRLQCGKALVLLQTGVAVSRGDTIVSSGVEAGRATVDNTITEPRRIIGVALEPAGATLAGHVAILRMNR